MITSSIPGSPALLPRLARLPADRLALLAELAGVVQRRGALDGLRSGLSKNASDNPQALEWLLRIAERLGDRPLRAFVLNFLLGQLADGQQVRRAFLKREGFEPPVTLVINPTMACNLACRGCYSFKMPRVQMDYGLLRRLLAECRQLGIRFITVSGGEPLLYDKLFRMLEEFSDLTFMAYTNGTLIDEAMADRIAAAGNLWPAFSVEGFGRETDQRRGPGVHDRVLQAMRLLRERGVMFGLSATATRQTSDTISSDAFIDYYLHKGVLFGWIFQYLPLGKDPDLSLMSTPAQRDALRAATARWHATRPAFVGDFWNDGACVGACLSANRYCYVTAEGRVQPCTFVHYYTHDLNRCSLREVLRSPFFRGIRARQPYDRNLLIPCKIIDRPEVLRELVREHRARPSYPGAETIVEDAGVRGFLDSYAARWRARAERAWAGPEYQGGRSVVVPFLGRIDVNQHFYPMRVDADQRLEAEQVGRRISARTIGGEVQADGEPAPEPGQRDPKLLAAG